MTHIHVHLHRTADAGTSEGAKKAAQTRKTHGHAPPAYTSEQHQNQTDKHYDALKYHGKVSGGDKNSPHYNAAKLHSDAAFWHNQAARTSRPEHVEKAHAATRKADAASQKLGHETSDAGTSEGAKKAAQSRKSGGTQSQKYSTPSGKLTPIHQMSAGEKQALTKHTSTTYTTNPQGRRMYHHPQYGHFRADDGGPGSGPHKGGGSTAARQHHETLLNRGYRRVGSGGWGADREDEYSHPSGHTVIVKQSGGFKNEYGPDIGKTSKELEAHLKKVHGK